jgi:hypothetical protein
MDNTFKDTIQLKVNKKENLCHLSIRTSEYKVEVFKIPLGDMASLLSQFKEGMRTDGDLDIKPETNKDINNIG